MLKMPKGKVIGEGLGDTGEYAYEEGLTPRFYDWLRATYKDPRDIGTGLSQSALEEDIASNWYMKRAKHARDNGDEETAKLYEHIANEESVHQKEFNQRFDKIFTRP